MVVLADTSAWVDALRGSEQPHAMALERASYEGTLVVGDLILMEVLQGIRDEARFDATRRRLARYRQVSLCGKSIAETASANYRLLRRRGVTVRGTIDVVIATWCIENGAAIIHNDRDLGAMEAHLGLTAYV